MNPTILALDASSTMIGWVLYEGDVLKYGEVALKDPDIAVRCAAAYAQLNSWLDYWQPDVVAIEAAVMRYAGTIVQAQVQGALMCAASLKGSLVVSIAPAAAKKALTGRGNADKLLMRQRAWECYGVRGEHASDAVGLALAACNLVKVERQVA